MIINHNMNALNAHRNMLSNINKSGKSMEKLSSGLRINRAGDDAAGLAISEKMRGQIRGLDQASRNAQDGISLIQTAEGALNETHSILQRMRELATQASNDTNTAEDREQIQNEINQLTSEVNRIGNTTEFNTKSLLKSSTSAEDVAKVVDGMKKGWLESAEKLVEDTYGLKGDGTKELRVTIGEINDGAGNTLATGGIGSDANGIHLVMNVDTDDFLPFTGESGLNKHGEGYYNDRIIAHEMTHAIMYDQLGIDAMTSLKDNSPSKGHLWFIEGTAELTHGADERVKPLIQNAAGTGIDNTNVDKFASHVKKLVDGTVAWGQEPNMDYAASYAIVSYMDATVRAASGGTESIKTVMSAMKTAVDGGTTNGVNALSTALGGTTAYANLDAFKTAVKSDDFKNYVKNAGDWADTSGDAKQNYGMKFDYGTTETDTGSATGSDHGGADKTPESIVPTTAEKENPTAHYTTVFPDSTKSAGGEVTLQIGANKGQSMSVKLQDMRAAALKISGGQGKEVTSKDGSAKAKFTKIDTNDSSKGVTNGTDSKVVEYALDISTHDNATAAIKIYDDAINQVSTFRSALGAAQNRLEHTINNLNNTSENLTAAESRVRDVDMAKEMMEFSKDNILQQAAQAMLAQAKQAPQGVLQLLR